MEAIGPNMDQYGHERMECVSSIILSGLLLATGIGIGMSGICLLYTSIFYIPAD